ncbi:Adhesion G Protein-Coupled Receptor B1 [Manis pentadactyla]|nr:Adhesion G Protein-Coupled Receptor B1 [Manis pentadactyla]
MKQMKRKQWCLWKSTDHLLDFFLWKMTCTENLFLCSRPLGEQKMCLSNIAVCPRTSFNTFRSVYRELCYQTLEPNLSANFSQFFQFCIKSNIDEKRKIAQMPGN